MFSKQDFQDTELNPLPLTSLCLDHELFFRVGGLVPWHFVRREGLLRLFVGCGAVYKKNWRFDHFDLQWWISSNKFQMVKKLPLLVFIF